MLTKATNWEMASSLCHHTYCRLLNPKQQQADSQRHMVYLSVSPAAFLYPFKRRGLDQRKTQWDWGKQVAQPRQHAEQSGEIQSGQDTHRKIMQVTATQGHQAILPSNILHTSKVSGKYLQQSHLTLYITDSVCCWENNSFLYFLCRYNWKQWNIFFALFPKTW